MCVPCFLVTNLRLQKKKKGRACSPCLGPHEFGGIPCLSGERMVMIGWVGTNETVGLPPFFFLFLPEKDGGGFPVCGTPTAVV